MGCTGFAFCPHCLIQRYARATRTLDRPVFADVAALVPDGTPPPQPLFVSHGSGALRCVGPAVLSRSLRPVVQQMGVQGASVYTLRALVSSAMRFHGFSLEDVCAWCGWAPPRTFTTFYQVVRELPLLRVAAPRWDAFPAALARAAFASPAGGMAVSR